jgi:hypothetical protein
MYIDKLGTYIFAVIRLARRCLNPLHSKLKRRKIYRIYQLLAVPTGLIQQDGEGKVHDHHRSRLLNEARVFQKCESGDSLLRESLVD